MLPFCRPSNLRAATYTLDVGTEVGGDYVVEALNDGDPSLPLGIVETTIGLQGDLGSALRIDGVAVIHHNFAAGTDLRLRVHSAASWGGAVDIEVTLTVPAWQGRFAPHLYFDVAAEEPTVANRTRRYFYLDNQEANDAAIKIGEVVVLGQVEYVECGLGRQARAPETFGRSLSPSRLGVATVHDYRSRHRVYDGQVRCDTTDQATLQALQQNSYGVRPFVSWPLSALGEVTGEPVFGRFVSPTFERAFEHLEDMSSPFAIEELSCGEAY
jgi:hypothetical protein